MKLYLVIEDTYENTTEDVCIFGAFSNEEKAEEIKNSLNLNFESHDESMRADIVELDLDQVTEDYNFFMYN